MSVYESPLGQRTIDDAEPDAAERLAKVKAVTGGVPNMYGNLANSPGLFASYMDGMAHLRQGSGFSAVELDVIFLTASRHFECHYCMAAHSFLADRVSKAPAAVVDAIRDDEPIPDERLAALAAFTKTMLTSQGHPSSDDVAAFAEAGFTDGQVLEVILAIAMKTISNWSNHVFDTPVDDMFSGRVWSPPEPEVPEGAQEKT